MAPTPPGASATWTIVPQGDRSLSLVFGDTVSIEIGRQCAMVAAALRAARIKGISDIVPTFNAVALHYQPRLLDAGTTVSHLTAKIEQVLKQTLNQNTDAIAARQIDIPVCYGDVYGPDLAHVAKHCNLSEVAVVRLHSDNPAYVFMLGFAPGAPYIGMHDPQLAIGRRSTPRTDVPAGSVAIANLQTMIYPNMSPGGWHIIGATPLQLFDPLKNPATLLAPGDTVRFVPISAQQFLAMRHEHT